MIELWKDIKDYEGFYQVSNLGRVKSLSRSIYDSRGYMIYRKGKIKKPSVDKNGYPQIGLCKNGTVITRKIHRLVAETFIPNPENKPEINHKDEDKLNNCVDNLEWVTEKENVNYGYGAKRRAESNRLLAKQQAKPVRCMETR